MERCMKSDEYKEWVSEMKRSKKMVPVFRDKVKEAQEEYRARRSHVDKVFRKWSNKLEDPMVEWMLDRQTAWVKEQEKEIGKWKYLLRLAKGDIDESKQIDIDELKERVRIEDLLGIAHKEFGRTMINCPIHNEQTPSCCVYHQSNSFYCFGCGAGGSVIDVLVERDGVSIKEAVTLLNSM